MNRPIDQQDLDPNAGRELIDEKQNVKDWMRVFKGWLDDQQIIAMASALMA